MASELFRTLFSFKSGKRFYLHSPAGERPFYSVYPEHGTIHVSTDAHDGVGVGVPSGPLTVPRDLLKAVAALSSSVGRQPNSNISCSELRISHGNTNCSHGYLLFGSNNSNNCYYSSELSHCESCVDCDRLGACKSCYDSQLSQSCERCAFADFSVECRDCTFVFGCRECKDCLGCVGLTGKQYCILNEQLSKDEYFRRVSTLNIHIRQFFDTFQDEYLELVRKLGSELTIGGDCTESSGKYLRGCSGIEDSVSCTSCFNSALLYNCDTVDSSLNCVSSRQITRSFNLVNCCGGDNIRFSLNCGPSVSNLSHCIDCRESSNLIGCVGLIGKEYCVLNKQLTKAQFEEFAGQLAEELTFAKQAGRFLPLSMSPFAYNQSEAAEHFPLGAVQAKLLGFRWEERQDEFKPFDYVKDIGSNLSDVPDTAGDSSRESIADDVFICSLSGRPFQVIGPELSLLTLLRIPLPVCCFDQRLINRNRRLNIAGGVN